MYIYLMVEGSGIDPHPFSGTSNLAGCPSPRLVYLPKYVLSFYNIFIVVCYIFFEKRYQ